MQESDIYMIHQAMKWKRGVNKSSDSKAKG